MDQVDLFYEKELKREMDTQKMDAIIAANAVSYGSPSWSDKGSSEKNRAWKTFINSLTWDKIGEKGKKKTIGEVLKTIKGLGMVKIKEAKKVE